MKTETIVVANLKCNGCATTVKKELSKLISLQVANVDLEKDSIEVIYEDSLSRETIIKRLHELGYPEATEKNGLLLQLKSYSSCMLGRISNL